MNICLVAILGTGILCSGSDGKTTVISDFCAKAKIDIEKFKNLSEAELSALQRPRKEAIANLRRTLKRDCSAPEIPSK